MKGEPLQASEGLTRRRFLTFSGWLALGVTTLGTPLAAQAARFNKELYQVTGGRIAMGTFVNIALFHPSKDQAQEAMEKAFEEMNRVIAILNCHDDSTPVSFLNHTGSLADLPPELAAVMGSSLQFHQTTAGAFDITVKPLLDLYENSFEKRHQPPENRQITQTLQAVGSSHLQFDNKRIAFQKEHMGVTLDGIAKGYIVDRTMDVLRAAGIKHALVNAGGDICVLGTRGDGNPWNIGIQDPWNEGRCLQTVKLSQGAIATSGNYEVYFDREKLYHHIISPRGGRPVEGLASVSVIAPTTMMADALSTSVYVMGVGKGEAFLRGLPGVGGLIVSSNRLKHYAGWPQQA